MSKGSLWVLFILGIVCVVGGIIFHSRIASKIGFALIAFGLFLGLKPDGVLRKEEVRESWLSLIENAHGRADEIFQNSQKFIEDTKVPSLNIEKKEIAPSLMSLFGERRTFLEVTDLDKSTLKPYQIFIGARDYGNGLQVSWYLTYKPSFLQALLSLISSGGKQIETVNDLNLFDSQDLYAYSVTIHSSVQKAVDKLMLELNQDPSKIDRKSRGFLGIS